MKSFLNKACLLCAVSLSAFSASSGYAQQAASPAGPIKNVVLVHGLYADASSWGKVIALLQQKGLTVSAVQNPTTSLEADVEATRRVLAQQQGPVILVGHSYGGMVISQAGDDPKVKGLVYIAARAPEAGEDYAALVRKFPPAPAGAGLTWSADGFGQLSQQAFLQDFAGDLPQSEAMVYYAVQQPMGKAVTTARTTVAAWHDKPSWYAISTQDRTIDPQLEQFMASRMHARTISLASSHVAMLSHAQEVANLIFSAAQEAGPAHQEPAQ